VPLRSESGPQDLADARVHARPGLLARNAPKEARVGSNDPARSRPRRRHRSQTGSQSNVVEIGRRPIGIAGVAVEDRSVGAPESKKPGPPECQRVQVRGLTGFEDFAEVLPGAAWSREIPRVDARPGSGCEKSAAEELEI